MLRRDLGNTPLQFKWNDLAEVIAKIGSIAGMLLFVAPFIRFIVQVSTNIAHYHRVTHLDCACKCLPSFPRWYQRCLITIV